MSNQPAQPYGTTAAPAGRSAAPSAPAAPSFPSAQSSAPAAPSFPSAPAGAPSRTGRTARTPRGGGLPEAPTAPAGSSYPSPTASLPSAKELEHEAERASRSNATPKADIERASELLGRVNKTFSQRVVGQERLRLALTSTLIASGHILLESVPLRLWPPPSPAPSTASSAPPTSCPTTSSAPRSSTTPTGR